MGGHGPIFTPDKYVSKVSNPSNTLTFRHFFWTHADTLDT